MPKRFGKYLSAVYAAMIVMVTVLAAFFYGIIQNDQVELGNIVEVSEDGGYFVNPGSGSVPDSPPAFLEPITPPPID